MLHKTLHWAPVRSACFKHTLSFAKDGPEAQRTSSLCPCPWPVSSVSTSQRELCPYAGTLQVSLNSHILLTAVPSTLLNTPVVTLPARLSSLSPNPSPKRRAMSAPSHLLLHFLPLIRTPLENLFSQKPLLPSQVHSSMRIAAPMSVTELGSKDTVRPPWSSEFHRE